MMQFGRYVFKRAESPQEFEAVHELNYRTFVDELGQYPSTGNGRLVDKFHDKNIYFIGLRDSRIVGMISAHGQPPFSVAQRISNPEILQGPGMRPLEVRLLAVEPEERNGNVLVGLLWTFYKHARDQGYTDLFISGVVDRVPFYQRLGFEPLGPAIAAGEAAFVPMAVSFDELQIKIQRLLFLWEKHLKRAASSDLDEIKFDLHPEAREPKLTCLLPGPVSVSSAVREAFAQPAIYHRGQEFIARFERVRRLLAEMTRSRGVALFNGSGTLGNEVTAAMLAADRRPGRGVLLVNGEFGQRLAQQATRFGLQPRILEWAWGQPWDLDDIDRALAAEPADSWVWGVHQESSTGVLNDLPGLVRVARNRSQRVCVDCISSLGAVPIDLSQVYLASGATGKSLGSYAGLAILFADAEALKHVDLTRVPSYLDLPATLATRGPRYTFPSATVLAAQAALTQYASPELARARFERYAAVGVFVRHQLRELGLMPLAEERYASPVITTFAPLDGESAEQFVARCRSWGFAIGGQSGYLAVKRLVQIATMGTITHEDCAPLFEQFRRWLKRPAAPVGEAAPCGRAAM